MEPRAPVWVRGVFCQHFFDGGSPAPAKAREACEHSWYFQSHSPIVSPGPHAPVHAHFFTNGRYVDPGHRRHRIQLDPGPV
jgi:hypothetical protein